MNMTSLFKNQCTKISLIFITGFTAMDFIKAQSFTPVTTSPVVTTAGDSRSVNWVDINSDGFIDLQITNGPSGGQNNFLYLNNGAGGFTAVIGDPIVNDQKPSDGSTWADADNDGDPDCFVANWYNINNLYYENNGNGTFTANTSNDPSTDLGYSETAAWGDYDNDGLVDLLVTNSEGSKKNFLYHHDGGHLFTRITTMTIANDTFTSRCVNFTDMDLDGDLDIFIANESNENENIYRNDGGGSFVRLTTGSLLNNGGQTMSSSWGDYDNDGDLDVFLANDFGNNSLFRNDGNFNFTLVNTDTVSNSGGNSFSGAWSDIDNDGDLDLFVTNSFHTVKRQVNFMYMNNGNGSFSRIFNTAPATDSSWSYGCAFGDYDNDGFEDLAVATVRFAGIDRPDLLYHNDGNTNHWLTCTLRGTVSNRSAIGARVRVKAIINGVAIWQVREISSQTSYCGQNDMRAHFGLGNAIITDSIKVEWPSGTLEYFTQIGTDQFISIIEGQGILGIKEKQNEGELNRLVIFPNPSTGKVTLKISGYQLEKGDHVKLKSMNGSLIMEEILTSPMASYQLDLKMRCVNRPGPYTVSIETPKGRWTGILQVF